MTTSGGNSWDTAVPLEAGTSDPTPITSLTRGSDWPYYSAWWVYTPAQDGGLILDSSGSTVDPGFYNDTYIYVYTGSTEATAVQVASGFAGLDMACTAGETYHIQVGCWDDVGDSGLEYILAATPYVYTAWTEVSDLERSESTWVGDITVTNGVDASTTTTGADASALTSVMGTALTPTSTVYLNRDGSAATAGPGVTGSGGYQGSNHYLYSASAGVRMVAGSLAQPSRYISTSDYADVTPADALGLEVEGGGGDGEVMGTSITYALTETSYDSSASGGAQHDAVGAWDYRLVVPSGSETLTGPFGRNSVTSGSVVTTSVAADVTIPVSAEIVFTRVIPSDPTFPTGGSIKAAGQWDLSVTLQLRRPLVRFKMPTTAAAIRRAIVTQVRATPSLRMLQRGGSGGMSGIPRMVGDPTRRGIRQGPGSVY